MGSKAADRETKEVLPVFNIVLGNDSIKYGCQLTCCHDLRCPGNRM